MSVEHHDLVHELPEFKEEIHNLKMNNAHFAKLFEEYHELTKEVERIETEVEPASTRTEEELKLKRLHLKDEMYAMLKAAK